MVARQIKIGSALFDFDVDTGDYDAALGRAEDTTKRRVDSMGRVFGSISGHVKRAGDSTAREFSAIDATVLRTTNNVRDSFRNISSSISNGFRAAGGSASQLLDPLKSIGSGIATVGRGFAVFGLAAEGVSTLGRTITGVASALLSSNAALEQTQVAFTQLTGSAENAQRLLGELRDFAAATPFEFPELANSARLLLAFGFEAEKIVPIMTNIGDAVGAIGGGSAEIDRVTRALGQMQAKGKVSAEEMLQLSELGINGFGLLAEQLGITVAEVQELTSSGKLLADEAIPLILRGFEQTFGGGMQAQAKTLNGLISSIKDNINIAFQRLTAPVFEQAKRGAEELARFVQSAEFESIVEDWTENIDEFADRVSDFVVNEGPRMVEIAKETAIQIGNIAKGIGDLIGFLVRVRELRSDGKLGAGADDEYTGAEMAADLLEIGNTAVKGAQDTGAFLGTTTGSVVRGRSTLETSGIEEDNYWVQLADVFDRLIGQEEHSARIIEANTERRREQAKAERELAEAMAIVEEAAARKFARDAQLGGISVDDPVTTQADIDRAVEAANMQLYAEAAARTAKEMHGLELADAQAAEAARKQTVIRQNQQAALLELNQTEQDYRNTLSATESVLLRAQEAITRVEINLHTLSSAYQDNLEVQRIYAAQGSEYASQLTAVEKAFEILHARQEAGLPLTEEQTALLENETAIRDRLTGGIDDAALATGQAAGQNALFMLAQDELNGLLKDGKIDIDEYNKRLDEAKSLYGDTAGAAGETKDSQEKLADVMTNSLIPVLDDVKRAIEYIAKPWLIEIDAATEEAVRELERVQRLINTINSTQMVAPTAAAGTSENDASGTLPEYGEGGLVTKPHLAIVGDEPEIIIPLSEIPANPSDFSAGAARGKKGKDGYGPHLAKLTSQGSCPPGMVMAEDGNCVPLSFYDETTIEPATDAMSGAGDEAEDFFAEAGRAVSLVEQALGLLTTLGEASVTLTPDIAGKIETLVVLTQMVSAAMRDAAFEAGQIPESGSEFLSFAGSALSTISSALDLLTALAEATIDFQNVGFEDKLAALRFVIETSVAAMKDSAYALGSEGLEEAEAFLTAAEQTLGVMTLALDLLERLSDSTGDFARFGFEENIATLKFLIEKAVVSMNDTSLAVGELHEGGADFLAAASTTLNLMTQAVDLIERLSDSGADFTRFAFEEHVATLKFLIEKAVVSMNDSAAAGGELHEGSAAFLENAGLVLTVMSSALDLLERLSESTANVDRFAFDESIATLKFLIEKAVISLGDTSEVMEDDFVKRATDLRDAALASLEVLTGTLALLESLEGTGVDLSNQGEALIGTIAALAGIARTVADLYGSVAESWDDDVNEEIVSLTAAVTSSLSALSGTLNLLVSLADTTDDVVSDQERIARSTVLLAETARDIANRFGEASTGWTDETHPGIESLSGAVGSSLSALSGVLNLVKSVVELGNAPIPAGRVAAIGTQLANLARQLAESFDAAAAGFREESNPSADALASAVGSATGAVGNVLRLVDSLTTDVLDSEGNATGGRKLKPLSTEGVRAVVDTLVALSVEIANAFREAALDLKEVEEDEGATLEAQVGETFGALQTILTTIEQLTQVRRHQSFITDRVSGLLDVVAFVLDGMRAIASRFSPEELEQISTLAGGLQTSLGALAAISDYTGPAATNSEMFQEDLGQVFAAIEAVSDQMPAVQSNAEEFRDAAFAIRDAMRDGSLALSEIPGAGGGFQATFGGMTLMVSAVPMADGGVVTRPTLIVAGDGDEPEGIIPLSKLVQLGGSGPGEVHAHFHIGREELRHIVYDFMDENYREEFQVVQITAFDGQSVNGAEGIGLTLKERGTVAKASLSTSSRRRAGRHGQYESGSFDPIKQSFVVYRDDGLDMPVNEFHAWVYGLFYPGETERVITGLLDVEGFETPLEVQGTARITAFGRDSPTEWRGTLEFMNPIWQTVEVKTATEIPVVVDGTVFSRPTWRFEAGDTVTRQRITITDRTGHGFRSLMIAVEPLEVFDESQYIVRTSFTQQVFALLDGILYFRVDADPRWPTFIDIYMGTAITNTLYAGRLDPAGMTLDPTINAGSYTCSTESAAENLATPSLSWIADVTGKHSGSQDYTFGMSGDEIVLASGSIGSESLQFDNDVDSFSLVTGVEAQSLSGLSLTLEAGYQPGLKDAPDSSGDDEGSVRVMRCIIKKFSEGGDHYAQWTLGLTTFPPTRSRIETTETTFTVLKETVWEDDMTVDDFQSAIGQYVGVPITQGEAGWFYLEFESGAPEIDLIQMQVHPKESMSEFYLKASTSDPDSGMLQAESFEPGESPVVVFESIWVDPVTLEPFEDVAETAGLTRDPIRGMARVVARYQLRDSSQWYVAWTRTITATAIGGKSVSYSNVSFDIPGAVQVAIGLEPVANREGFADWATLRITAQPTLQLDADKIPALLSSAAIDARIISGMLRHSASGQTLTFDKFLVDAPGIEIVADPSVDIVPISGIGPYYGVPTASAGPRLIELRPGSNTLELTGDLAEPSAMVTAEWRDGHAI